MSAGGDDSPFDGQVGSFEETGHSIRRIVLAEADNGCSVASRGGLPAVAARAGISFFFFRIPYS